MEKLDHRLNELYPFTENLQWDTASHPRTAPGQHVCARMQITLQKRLEKEQFVSPAFEFTRLCAVKRVWVFFRWE